jgi:hypothetical protein
MKKVVISVALALGLGLMQARAQEEQPVTNDAGKGVVGRVADDLKESTRAVHEINKENLAAEKEAAAVRHADATKPNADFQEFKKAKGLKRKSKVVAESIGESSRQNTEKERKRRKQIQSHEAYGNRLEEQRESRETAIKNQNR